MTKMEKELQILLRRNLDGYHGYKLAGESIKNDNFRNFLKMYALQRKKYAEEIESELIKRDMIEENQSSVPGDLHEAFVKIGNSISSMTDSKILEECARGENQTVSDYEKVLKSNQLPPDLQKMAMRHHTKIRAAEQTLRKLTTVI